MTAKEFIKSKQNGVLLNDYTLQEMEWFMTEFAKQKQNNMTAKDKAKELVHRFLNEQNDTEEISQAKQCALICVDEMLAFDLRFFDIEFLKEVKQEIEKL